MYSEIFEGFWVSQWHLRHLTLIQEVLQRTGHKRLQDIVAEKKSDSGMTSALHHGLDTRGRQEKDGKTKEDLASKDQRIYNYV